MIVNFCLYAEIPGMSCLSQIKRHRPAFCERIDSCITEKECELNLRASRE